MMKKHEWLSHIASLDAKAHTQRPPQSLDRRTAHILAFFLGVQGLLCLIFTEHIYRVLPFVLGFTMIALGSVQVWIGFQTKEFRDIETKITANGMVFVLLGIIVVWNYARADFIIGAIWGAIGVIKGTESLNLAISGIARRTRFAPDLIRCVAELALGILLLLDPSSKLQHHVFFLGLELIAVSRHMLRESRRQEEADPPSQTPQ